MYKITVFSLYDHGLACVGDLTSQNHKQYCSLHGYDYVCKKDNFTSNLHPSWEKISSIKEHLLSNKEIDYLLWIDADAFFQNPQIRIETILTEKPLTNEIISHFGSKQFLIPKDPFFYISMHDKVSPCCGIFLLRNCKECINFLEYLFSFHNNFPSNSWDQAAFVDIIFNDKYDLTKFVFLSQKVMNSFWMQYEKNFFITHLAASKNEHRIGLFNCLNPFNLNKNNFDKYISENGLLNFYKNNK